MNLDLLKCSGPVYLCFYAAKKTKQNKTKQSKKQKQNKNKTKQNKKQKTKQRIVG